MELEKDPVIEMYKKDVDLTLLRENLKLTPAQRLHKFSRFYSSVLALRGAAKSKPGQANTSGSDLTGEQ